MKYCINPECRQRSNSDEVQECQSCGNSLVINNSDRTTNENDHRYRIIKCLKYNPSVCTEVFEVEDLEPSNNEKIKILKAIHDNDQTYNNDRLFTVLTRLFEREQAFLYFNENEGMPKGYDIFSLTLINGKKIHCLVMEKIVGENLEEWLKKNLPIDEKRALKWLKQIVEILDAVHEKLFFHRDIKPSNIMWRKSDNKLVLIDFGAVKEISQTVTNANANEENLLTTKIGTRGYVAPEQDARKAVPQSDFYALGRTFVYLLTGKQPHDIGDSSIFKWHESTKHRISPSLIKLINELMEE
jgi:serine/threonine protein kinase